MEFLNNDKKHMAPSQSRHLYHFTERGRRPHTTDAQFRLGAIQNIKNATQRAQTKLQHILWDKKLMATYQHGVTSVNGRRCACFTEATDADLAYLMSFRQYQPYAIIVSRETVLLKGGGSVMYVMEGETLDRLGRQQLADLAVRTSGGSNDWTWEREWRIPAYGKSEWVPVLEVTAILVGDASWRPASREGKLPALWLESPVWVWNAATSTVDTYAPGDLN
ncbi:hypothetical protein [Streptomyces sp. NPDC101145]|uniref:hypothetical protein n=1 Tax=Streptomyces sp. NPDC101145 TaxID=3366112 RepID=UPI0037F2C047